MILRRLSQSLKDQNWAAIAIEFVLLVLGVFLGIQVANWNEERVERAQEKGLLVRLHEDFSEMVAGQTRDLRFLDQQLADQGVILKSLDACHVDEEDGVAFQRGINMLGYINPPRLLRRTVDEMGAAGTRDTIENEAIKRELAAIVAIAEWRNQGYDATARLTEHYRYIVEERVRYDLTKRYPDAFLGDFVGMSFDIAELCANSEVASAVSAISNATYERRNAYAPLLKRYQAFLPFVEAELVTRWQINLTETANP